MNLEQLVEKINNIDKQFIPLDFFQGAMSKKDFTELLKELKNSKYCFPLVFNEDLKFNLTILPSIGGKHKQYIIDDISYSHLEKF